MNKLRELIAKATPGPWFSNASEALRWIRDEARQFYTDNPQVAAHLFEAARFLEELRAENERLVKCLKKANENHEHFEREWYLAKDENERLRKELDEARGE